MQTGVYSNTQIKEAIKEGHIIFHPYQPEHINGSSVDVTLGSWFFRTDRKSPASVYSPLRFAKIAFYFGFVERIIDRCGAFAIGTEKP
jgi:deoxycytidine triphosphate deaminase